jgi:hypothetical protein
MKEKVAALQDICATETLFLKFILGNVPLLCNFVAENNLSIKTLNT